MGQSNSKFFAPQSTMRFTKLSLCAALLVACSAIKKDDLVLFSGFVYEVTEQLLDGQFRITDENNYDLQNDAFDPDCYDTFVVSIEDLSLYKSNDKPDGIHIWQTFDPTTGFHCPNNMSRLIGLHKDAADKLAKVPKVATDPLQSGVAVTDLTQAQNYNWNMDWLCQIARYSS